MIKAIVSTQVNYSDPLETSLLQDDLTKSGDEEVRKCIAWMDSFERYKKGHFEELGESSNRYFPLVENPLELEDK